MTSSPQTGDWVFSTIYSKTRYFVYYVTAARNCCLIIEMLPELPRSCQFTDISLFVRCIWIIFGVWVTVGLVVEKAYNSHSLPSKIALCTVTASTVPHRYIHQSFYMPYGGENNKRCIRRPVVDGELCFSLSLLSPATPRPQVSSLHGTFLFLTATMK